MNDGGGSSAKVTIGNAGGNTRGNGSIEIVTRRDNANMVASGAASIAIGSRPRATASNAIAIGAGALASGSNSIALGGDTGNLEACRATNTSAIAIGANTQATANPSVAIGEDARATVSNSVAIGRGQANNQDSVSIGSSGPNTTSNGQIRLGAASYTGAFGNRTLNVPLLHTVIGSSDNTTSTFYLTPVAPHASAVLQLEATPTGGQGFLPPRHTDTTRDAITSPATGLMVFNTTTNKINFYNGTAWRAVDDSAV
jgi:hypothetical protein